MARPVKERKVYQLPEWECYGPVAASEARTEELMVLSAEEYEAIRLIDLEGCSQAECAASMEVARTTAQAIYSEARKKLAAALVYGRPLQVAGGNYELCAMDAEHPDRHRWGCPRWARRRQLQGKGARMKIAVPYADDVIDQHFGKSEAFKLYTVEKNTITASEIVRAQGQGHRAMIDFLTALDVDAVICGGIGATARDMLQTTGIALYAGVKGLCDRAAAELVAGTLQSQREGANCHHGQEVHGTGCGSHGMGHGMGCRHGRRRS